MSYLPSIFFYLNKTYKLDKESSKIFDYFENLKFYFSVIQIYFQIINIQYAEFIRAACTSVPKLTCKTLKTKVKND